MQKIKKITGAFLCFLAFLTFAFPSSAAVLPEKVIVGGETFGVKIKAEGVVVVTLRNLETESGKVNPAADVGIKSGDIIKEANGEKIKSAAEFRDCVADGNGAEIVLSVETDGVRRNVSVLPQKDSADGTYHIGVVVKDSTAGLGTVTFYNGENGTFGALGHGICEGETSTLFPLAEAEVYHTDIYSVQKGESGKPGELRGLFLDDVQIGNLLANTRLGVFGTISEIPLKEAVPVADKSEVKAGHATVISTVDGNGPKEYEAEISKIDISSGEKNFVVKITDPVLLEKTGGIVQGMSGSPIIQNGKLIGAVTHVFINDPTSGYGLFIGNMLDTAGEIGA